MSDTLLNDENDEIDSDIAYIPDDTLEQRPHWTVKRVIYLMIALVIIAALVVYMVLPALQIWLTPPPSPLAPPLNL